MKTALQSSAKTSPYKGLGADALLAILAEKDAAPERQLHDRERFIRDRDRALRKRDKRIKLLEEQLRLATIRMFAASCGKLPFQVNLFDQAELEATQRELDEQLDGCSDEQDQHVADAQQRRRARTRERGFAAAPRPMHPPGNCSAHPSLLAYVITAKYADGLPLYRLEGIPGGCRQQLPLGERHLRAEERGVIAQSEGRCPRRPADDVGACASGGAGQRRRAGRPGGDRRPPRPLQRIDDEGLLWRSAALRPLPDDARIQLVVQARGSQFFGETGTGFARFTEAGDSRLGDS